MKQAPVQMFTAEEKHKSLRNSFVPVVLQVQKGDGEPQQGDSSSGPSIRRWHRNFLQAGNVANRHGGGRPPTSDEMINEVREIYKREPSTSTRAAATELGVSHTTVCNI